MQRLPLPVNNYPVGLTPQALQQWYSSFDDQNQNYLKAFYQIFSATEALRKGMSKLINCAERSFYLAQGNVGGNVSIGSNPISDADLYDMYYMARYAERVISEVGSHVQFPSIFSESAQRLALELRHEAVEVVGDVVDSAANIFSSGADGLSYSARVSLEVASNAYAHVHADVEQVGHAAVEHINVCEHQCDCNCKDGCEEMAVWAAIIFALGAIANSAFITANYTIVKGSSALVNLIPDNNPLTNYFQDQKIVRSIVRIASIFLGVFVGTLGGMTVGAIVGSAIPGLGTGIGATLGAIWGGAMTGAAGAFVAKYVSRFVSSAAVSWGWYGNEAIINPNNPSKYRLNASQMQNMRNQGVTAASDALITNMLVKAKEQKNRISTFSFVSLVASCFLQSPEQRERDDYNELIEGIKNSPSVVLSGKFQAKSERKFFWENAKWKQPTSNALEPLHAPLLLSMR